MSRLIVFGDSFSFGHGLDHSDLDPRVPNPKSWPYIYSELTGVEVVNLAHCGASNKFIWHNVMNCVFDPNDTVVIQWSCPDRYCVIHDYDATPGIDFSTRNNWQVTSDDHIAQYMNWQIDHPDFPQATAYYKNLYNSMDAWFETAKMIDHCNRFVKEQVANCFHIAGPSYCEFESIVDPEKYKHRETDSQGRILAETGPIVMPSWFDTSMIVATMDIEAEAYPLTACHHLGTQGTVAFAKRLTSILK